MIYLTDKQKKALMVVLSAALALVVALRYPAMAAQLDLMLSMDGITRLPIPKWAFAAASAGLIALSNAYIFWMRPKQAGFPGWLLAAYAAACGIFIWAAFFF
nr:hypothetical protein [bacterium]